MMWGNQQQKYAALSLCFVLTCKGTLHLMPCHEISCFEPTAAAQSVIYWFNEHLTHLTVCTLIALLLTLGTLSSSRQGQSQNGDEPDGPSGEIAACTQPPLPGQDGGRCQAAGGPEDH